MERNIYKISNVVKQVLTDDERARGDDFYLYGRVMSKIDSTFESMSAKFFFNNAKELKYIPFESVRRSRQKIQAENEELKPSESIVSARKRNEEVMKDYAKS